MKNETTTMLTGTDLLTKVEEMQSANATKSQIAIACGYIKENEKPDFVGFYTELLTAKGIIGNDSEDDASDVEEGSLKAELIQQYGEGAVNAFLEIWSEDELSDFEDAFVGEYSSGEDYAREVVEECYCLDLPAFVCIDWEETWRQLSYDYYCENGFIFRNY